MLSAIFCLTLFTVAVTIIRGAVHNEQVAEDFSDWVWFWLSIEFISGSSPLLWCPDLKTVVDSPESCSIHHHLSYLFPHALCQKRKVVLRPSPSNAQSAAAPRLLSASVGLEQTAKKVSRLAARHIPLMGGHDAHRPQWVLSGQYGPIGKDDCGLYGIRGWRGSLAA